MKADNPTSPPHFLRDFFQSPSFSAWFFGALFFLASADMFFTTHILGFNLRWGQMLLLLAALPALRRLWTDFQRDSLEGKTRLRFLLAWLPFFILYGIAALYAHSPFLTGIKWGWGIFNISLAALVCLNPRQDDSLERGFQGGIILISAFIWMEAIAIYGFSPATTLQDLGPGNPAAVSFLSIPIGYAQTSLRFMDLQTYRPNAFYYEPSFAACALTFSFFLLFFLDLKKSAVKSGWIPALVLSSVILSSSRTGILSAAIFFLLTFSVLGFRSKPSFFRSSVLKTLVISALLIGLFCVFPNGRKYMQFLGGPLGSGSAKRFNNTAASEGGRLENAKQCLKLWAKSPLLGYGVLPRLETGNRGLAQISLSTWFEIGLESGILGVLGFLFAILYNMRLAWKKSSDFPLKTLILAAWIIHFTVHLFLSQTFPRLDYWLLFFLSIRLLLWRPEVNTENNRRF